MNIIIKFAIDLLCISYIVLYIYSQYLEYRLYREYKETFEDLKQYHKMRYKLYFGGEKSEIDTYTQGIEELAQVLLDVGEDFIHQKNFNKKKKEEIKMIMEQTKKLLETNQS